MALARNDIKVIKTDLQQQQVEELTNQLDEHLTWYYNYSATHGHTHYAVAYTEDHGIYLFPKKREYDFRLDSEDVSKYFDNHAVPDDTVFAGISAFIDVGSVYDGFIIYDTVSSQNISFEQTLQLSAEAAIFHEREIEIQAEAHFDAKVRSILTSELETQGLGRQRKLVKRSRTSDCNNPTTYVSGTGDFKQDRHIGSPNYLGGPVTGDTFCGRRGNDQKIDGHSERWTDVCHTTASKPVGYSIRYYNETCCSRKMGSWEHHGCRKGERADQTVPPYQNRTKRTNVYSWTIYA